MRLNRVMGVGSENNGSDKYFYMPKLLLYQCRVSTVGIILEHGKPFDYTRNKFGGSVTRSTMQIYIRQSSPADDFSAVWPIFPSWTPDKQTLEVT